MGSSKNLFLLLAVLVLLISYEVAASGQDNMKTSGVVDASYGGRGGRGGRGGGGRGGGGRGGGGGGGGRGCRYGCCRRYRYGPGCNRCCASANEAPDAEFEDDVKN